jgi:superfamily II DNA or RNA helicase
VGESLEGVDILCINTAHKKEMEVDLLIVDEAHRSLSPQFSRIYSSIKYKKLLTLTATLPHDPMYEHKLKQLSPVRYVKTVQEGVEIGALSDYVLYNIKCKWDKQSLIKYNRFNAIFTDATVQLSILRRTMNLNFPSVFDIAKTFRGGSGPPEVVKYSKQFWTGMSLRKQAVFSNYEKTLVAKRIIDAAPADKK